jgi:hypothetical protein
VIISDDRHSHHEDSHYQSNRHGDPAEHINRKQHAYSGNNHSDSEDKNTYSEKLTKGLLIHIADFVHVMPDDKIDSLLFPYRKTKPKKHQA